jgi:hypothetical protein
MNIEFRLFQAKGDNHKEQREHDVLAVTSIATSSPIIPSPTAPARCFKLRKPIPHVLPTQVPAPLYVPGIFIA